MLLRRSFCSQGCLLLFASCCFFRGPTSQPPRPCPRSYVPASVTCPQCRQKGVYKGAVRLRQLEKVLKTR